MKLDRAILAGLSDLFAATLVLIPFIETSINKNPMLTLIAIVSLFQDCNLHHGQTAARYRCDRIAFDSCRFNSDCRNASRFFSWHHWPK